MEIAVSAMPLALAIFQKSSPQKSKVNEIQSLTAQKRKKELIHTYKKVEALKIDKCPEKVTF